MKTKQFTTTHHLTEWKIHREITILNAASLRQCVGESFPSRNNDQAEWFRRTKTNKKKTAIQYTGTHLCYFISFVTFL